MSYDEIKSRLLTDLESVFLRRNTLGNLTASSYLGHILGTPQGPNVLIQDIVELVNALIRDSTEVVIPHITVDKIDQKEKTIDEDTEVITDETKNTAEPGFIQIYNLDRDKDTEVVTNYENTIISTTQVSIEDLNRDKDTGITKNESRIEARTNELYMQEIYRNRNTGNVTDSTTDDLTPGRLLFNEMHYNESTHETDLKQTDLKSGYLKLDDNGDYTEIEGKTLKQHSTDPTDDPSSIETDGFFKGKTLKDLEDEYISIADLIKIIDSIITYAKLPDDYPDLSVKTSITSTSLQGDNLKTKNGSSSVLISKIISIITELDNDGWLKTLPQSPSFTNVIASGYVEASNLDGNNLRTKDGSKSISVSSLIDAIGNIPTISGASGEVVVGDKKLTISDGLVTGIEDVE